MVNQYWCPWGKICPGEDEGAVLEWVSGVCGVAVSMAAFQAVDPGSTPGTRTSHSTSAAVQSWGLTFHCRCAHHPLGMMGMMGLMGMMPSYAVCALGVHDHGHDHFVTHTWASEGGVKR